MYLHHLAYSTIHLQDRLLIIVTNLLTEPSTVHWHGIHHIGSLASDGVPFVTQPLIQPGDSYIYDFVVDEPGECSPL